MEGAESKLCFAREHGHLLAAVDSRDVALGLWALIDGLLLAWMSGQESFSLSQRGEAIVATYLDAICRRSTELSAFP